MAFFNFDNDNEKMPKGILCGICKNSMQSEFCCFFSYLDHMTT